MLSPPATDFLRFGVVLHRRELLPGETRLAVRAIAERFALGVPESAQRDAVASVKLLAIRSFYGDPCADPDRTVWDDADLGG